MVESKSLSEGNTLHVKEGLTTTKTNISISGFSTHIWWSSSETLNFWSEITKVTLMYLFSFPVSFSTVVMLGRSQINPHVSCISDVHFSAENHKQTLSQKEPPNCCQAFTFYTWNRGKEKIGGFRDYTTSKHKIQERFQIPVEIEHDRPKSFQS